MIPVRYQAQGTTSPALLHGGGRRTQCPSGGHRTASVTAPLSRQIHDLEDEVGTKLFVRGKSGMRLTDVLTIVRARARSAETTAAARP